MKLTALCFDNAASSLAVLRSIVENMGFEAVCAHSGTDVLRVLSDQRFSLIIVSLQPGDMDGVELLSQIKQSRGYTSKTRVVGLTSTRVKRERDMFLNDIVNDLILRPYSAARIRESIRGKGATSVVSTIANDNTESGVINLWATETEVSPIDHVVLGRLVDEISVEHTLSAIDSFRGELDEKLQVLKNRPYCKDVGVAVAHPIKSVARTIGAPDLARAAENLETACRLDSDEDELRDLSAMLNKSAQRFVIALEKLDFSQLTPKLSMH